MSARITVGSLLDALGELDREAEIRIVHQESYPLQETIGGFWVAQSNDECELCDETADSSTHRQGDPDFDHGFESKASAEDGVVYLVANGAPRDGSPYGDRRAWEEMESVR